MATHTAGLPAAPTGRVPHRAAVSVLSSRLVQGPVRPAVVAASAAVGCYLLVDLGPEHGQDVLPVLTPAALALPTAVRLAYPAPELGTLAVGAPAAVGEGRVVVGDLTIETVRTIAPARVRRLRPTVEAERESDWTDLLARIGLGPGLTPLADDVLAGHLLVAAALGRPAPDLTSHLHRTSAVSASLLRAAAQGYAVTTVVAYIDAVLAEDPVTAARVRPQVEAIGHTSGSALLRGIHDAVDLLGQHTNERTVA